MKFWVGIALCSLLFSRSLAQDTASIQKPFSAECYIESYFSWIPQTGTSHEKPENFFNHKKNNTPGINAAIGVIRWNDGQARAAVGLIAGHYSKYNMAAEPGILQHVYEATLGVKLSTRNDLWLDAGVFNSHIGNEGVIGSDCWTVTRSIVAENSPYYESGIRLSYQRPSGKWNSMVLLLNSWQRIARPTYQTNPSYGFQLQYNFSSQNKVVYNAFLGSARPDSENVKRWYHNVYGIYNVSSKWALCLSTDFGMDFQFQSASYWYSPVACLRYRAGKNCWFALRAEYFHDPQRVILVDPNRESSSIAGISINADWAIAKGMLLRAEWRNLQYYSAKWDRLQSLQPLTMALTFKR